MYKRQIYDRLAWGLLTASLAALGWLVYRLLAFERALRTDDFERFRYGEGIWEQIFSRFRFERERAARRKKEYRSLLREIRKSTNAMPDGAVILDANNDIVACNGASKQLAGLKRKKDRGQRVDNIIRDPAFREYLAKGKFKDSVRIRSPLQEDHWLACRIVPYGAEQRLLLVQDITDRQRLTMLRREFVANASHELRTPLTVITGYLDTLVTDDESPESWEKPLQQMLVQANRMNKVVGELLELSRLESAGAAPLDEFVDVSALLGSIRKSVVDNEAVPEIVIDAKSDAQLRGNAAEIETVVINLVSNAIRHTPEDGHVLVTWTSDADGGQISVADTGIGIESEHIPRLTERFFRVDTGRSRDQGGVGLGLAIVKHALERHGAVLKITSTPGEGSTFSCQFPPERLLLAEADTITEDRQTA